MGKECCCAYKVLDLITRLVQVDRAVYALPVDKIKTLEV
jgi:hypothetical protein